MFLAGIGGNHDSGGRPKAKDIRIVQPKRYFWSPLSKLGDPWAYKTINKDVMDIYWTAIFYICILCIIISWRSWEWWRGLVSERLLHWRSTHILVIPDKKTFMMKVCTRRVRIEVFWYMWWQELFRCSTEAHSWITIICHPVHAAERHDWNPARWDRRNYRSTGTINTILNAIMIRG